MISIFYIAVLILPIIAVTNGYSEVKKSVQMFRETGDGKLRKSLQPAVSDIFLTFLLAGFVIAYSCGPAG